MGLVRKKTYFQGLKVYLLQREKKKKISMRNDHAM